MAALGAQQAAAAAMANAPKFTPIAGGTTTTKPVTSGTTVNNNVSVTGYNLTSPAATGATVSNQLKYGSTVNTTTLAGILAASANVRESRVPAPAQSVSARLRDR